MTTPVRIALPKGRLSEETLEFLHSRGLTSLKSFPEDRKLIVKDEQTNIEYLLIRSQDVGTYVEQGAADMGVIGFDIISENNYDVYVPLAFDFGYCRLSVAYPENKTEWKSKKNIRVASKYPHLTDRYFFEQGYNIQIIKLYGSIEIAPLTGISDVIVDLVSTGKTLKANNLTEDGTMLESTACLVVNPASYVFKRKRILSMINTLKQENT